MSELISNETHSHISRHLLTTVSALALVAYMSSATVAKAEDASRPTLWIELGGQMESLQGVSRPFNAPFMAVQPVPSPEGADYKVFPDAYDPALFSRVMHPLRHAFGFEGSLIFQPQSSDWTVSAAI
ncbi:MAG TPA: hypothetical protein VL026_07285, partial [Rhizomicrobium sp.]|nr:hypothetical protein [Rhizomicrobium sp.]